MGECERCDGDDHISFTCNECGGTFCSQHRLPENHACEALRTKSEDSWFKDDLLSRRNRGRESISRGDEELDAGEPGASDDPPSADATGTSPDQETPGPTDCGICGEDAYLTCDDCGETFCATHIQTTRHECPDAPAHRTGAATVGVASDSADESSGVTAPLKRIGGSLWTVPPAIGGLLLTLFLLPVRKPKLSVLLVLAVVSGVVVTDGVGPSVEDVDRVVGDFESNLSGREKTTDSGGGIAAGTTTSPSGIDADRVEVLVHQRVNEVRSNRGLRTLSHDSRLRGIASDYSERMGTQGFFSHESPSGDTFEDRYEAASYDCRVEVGSDRYVTGAENILYTYANTEVQLDNGSVEQYDTESELADAIVRSWMNSQGHRENILKPYWRNEGIGVYIFDNPDGPGKKVYATQNFC